MTDRPKEGFSIGLNKANLSVNGEGEYKNLPAASLELKTGSYHTTEITISLDQAQQLTENALREQTNPLEGYTEEAKKAAYEWAGVDRE